VDAEVRVRIILDPTSGIPILDVRTWRRSPCECSATAFTPTAAGIAIQAQFAEVLCDAIHRAALAAEDPRSDAA
jgi:hypothetical protein